MSTDVLSQAIDPASDRAVYRQIADHLRDAIGRGSLGQGDQLPSEAQLVSHYGVTRQALESEARADTTISQVKAPLLMVYALDDVLWLAQLKRGRHDGERYSLRYRDAVKDHREERFGEIAVAFLQLFK